MATTPQDILNCPDKHIHKGFDQRVVRALVAERDRFLDLNVNEYWFDLDGPAAKALDERVSVHVKEEEIVDMGDGRDGLDVICLDGKPVAIVREQGYDNFGYLFVILDLKGVDEIADAVRAMQKDTLCDMSETAVDADIREDLGLKDIEAPKP